MSPFPTNPSASMCHEQVDATMASYFCHESEWVYSTVITKRLHLSALNEYIHSIPSVSHTTELFIFICGYAFNPVMFPFWLVLVHRLSFWGLRHVAEANHETGNIVNKWWDAVSSTYEHAAILNTVFYFVSVLITLVFTELSKASFATRRPLMPTSGPKTMKNEDVDKSRNEIARNIEWKRRYGALVTSLKSKHSFPSGDCAQAMNVCIFLWRYVPVTAMTSHDSELSMIFKIVGVSLWNSF